MSQEDKWEPVQNSQLDKINKEISRFWKDWRKTLKWWEKVWDEAY